MLIDRAAALYEIKEEISRKKLGATRARERYVYEDANYVSCPACRRVFRRIDCASRISALDGGGMRRRSLCPLCGREIGSDLPLRERGRAKKRHKKTRKACHNLMRDADVCFFCGSGAGITTHHILALAEFPQAGKSRWNLLALCLSCHKKLHDIDQAREDLRRVQLILKEQGDI